MKFFTIFFLIIFSILTFQFTPNQHIKKEPTDEIELGRRLFFDNKLSKNNEINCGTCHKESYAFADTTPFSIGVEGRLGKRNTPSVMNMLSREIHFYDGRAKTLEEQAVFPIQDHNEMDILMEQAVQKIAQDKNYQIWFQKIYHSTPTKENIVHALATFQRSLESFSPFDKYMAGDTNAISSSAKRGHKLFLNDRTKCFDCHFSPDFTGDEFKNIGLFDGKKYNDSGRYHISKNPMDIGKFKVPGLRNVAVTAPYMHDGSFKTLKETIRYYNDIYATVPHPINEDTLVRTKIDLSEQDIVDLENFLISLTDYRYLKLIKNAKSTAHRRRK